MLKFSLKYFALTIALLITEVCIALYAHDDFVRPYIGDFLVVILIYCFVRSFFNFPFLQTAVAVLIFSYTVELLQYFNIVKVLGLEQIYLARLIIGTSFSWQDIIAYTTGISLVIILKQIALKTGKKITSAI